MKVNTDKPHRIFAESLEQGTLDQFESAMNCDFAVRGALMPDAHFGYSLPIGSVVATSGVIVPAWVGYDIGCGMCALPTTFDSREVKSGAKKIFSDIYKSLPVGFAHNRGPTPWPEGKKLPRTPVLQRIFSDDGLKQIGSLGGGNHFAEIGADESGRVWIIIHSGSRGIGHAVASHYMKVAAASDRAREGHFGLRVDGTTGHDYIVDLQFCLAFALENRREIMRRLVAVVSRHCDGGGQWDELINRNHNHAEFKDGCWIHRKGATHAEVGMMGVIPANMRDGSFIVRGKGNPESLSSSSHGAGRSLGRKEARRTLTMEQFRSAMSGVVGKIEPETLDESPFAYKDIFEVLEQQKDLVDVVAHVLPIINIKG
jgi:tRNA-splicing ligase RtcB